MGLVTRKISCICAALLLSMMMTKTTAASDFQNAISSLVGRHPYELTRNPNSFAAIRQAMGSRFPAGEMLLNGVASELTLVNSRYIVGHSMAPHSGGDFAIFAAFDTISGAAYVMLFERRAWQNRPDLYEVFGPKSSAPWPISLRSRVTAWRPFAGQMITFSSDDQAAEVAGPRPTPMAPPPRRWVTAFGQGNFEAGIVNDTGSRFTISCSAGGEEKLPGVSFELKSNRGASLQQPAQIFISVDGINRSDNLRLILPRGNYLGAVDYFQTIRDRRTIERLLELLEALRRGSSFEIRIPALNLMETFSLSGADVALNGIMDGCGGSNESRPPRAEPPSPARQANARIGPSFDCSSLSIQREALAQLICSDDKLAVVDLRFVQAFQALRQQSSEDQRRDLRREANEFQNRVVQRCHVSAVVGAARAETLRVSRNCIEAAYEEQRRLFLARLTRDALLEAERPIERHIALQQMLRDLGYLPPNAPIDGVYGPITRTAIIDWQRSRTVPETGFLGDKDASDLETVIAAARARSTPPSPTAQAAIPPRSQVATTPPPTNPSLPAVQPRTTRLTGSGTAFVVKRSDGLLLTNHHVIEGCSRLTLSSGISVEVIAQDPRRDLALVKTNSTLDAQVKFRRDQTLDLGEPVFVFGFPLYGLSSTALNLTNGIVTALVGINDNPARFQLNAGVQPGNSGGPVVDNSGLVIGVAVARLSDRAIMAATGTIPQSVNFAVRGQVVESFLLENGIVVERLPATESSRELREIAQEMQRAVFPILCYGHG